MATLAGRRHQQSLYQALKTLCFVEETIKKYLSFAVQSYINAGEPVLKRKLIKPGTPGFMPGALKPGMRAFTFSVGPLTATAGFVVPGMHVDLVMTYRASTPGRRGRSLISETIMQKVRVLAAGRRINDGGKTSVKAKTITVEVTPKDVERLALAVRLGQIRLVVRSIAREAKKEKLGPYTHQDEVTEFSSGRPRGGPTFMVAKAVIKKGRLLRDADIEWRQFPYGTDSEGKIVRGRYNWGNMKGALIRRDFKVGEALEKIDVTLQGEQDFIFQTLKPGMRAMTVRGRRPVFLSPGDHADLLLTRSQRVRVSNRHNVRSLRTSETILKSARILSFNDRGATTIEVTPVQVQRLTLAQTMGQLSFVVRRQEDTNEAPVYSTELEISKSYNDSFVKYPVGEIDKRNEELNRNGQGAPLPLRVYGGNVPKTINVRK